MTYERTPGLTRARNYRLIYSRKNAQKRVEYRGIYERVLLGWNSYSGTVIRSNPSRLVERAHLFYINDCFVAYIKVAHPVFTPTIHFVRTDYNKFRLFLRNLGIKATGRKHVTTIELPDGEKLKFDHSDEMIFTHPDIPFSFEGEPDTTRFNQGNALDNRARTFLRQPGAINVAQQVYTPTLPLAEQQILDIL